MSEEENIEVTDKFGIMNILEDSELPKKVPIISVQAKCGEIACLQGFITVDNKRKDFGLEIEKKSYLKCLVVQKKEKLTIEEISKRLKSWVLMTFDSNKIKGGICLMEKHQKLNEKLFDAILYTLFDSLLGMLTFTVRNWADYFEGEEFQNFREKCTYEIEGFRDSSDPQFIACVYEMFQYIISNYNVDFKFNEIKFV